MRAGLGGGKDLGTSLSLSEGFLRSRLLSGWPWEALKSRRTKQGGFVIASLSSMLSMGSGCTELWRVAWVIEQKFSRVYRGSCMGDSWCKPGWFKWLHQCGCTGVDYGQLVQSQLSSVAARAGNIRCAFRWPHGSCGVSSSKAFCRRAAAI